MRRDTTPDNGASLELRTWLITLFVLAVSVLLRCAIMSLPLDKVEAFGEDHFKRSVLIVMQSKAAKRDTSKGGKGVRKSESTGCISLHPSFARFRQFKPKGTQFKPNK